MRVERRANAGAGEKGKWSQGCEVQGRREKVERPGGDEFIVIEEDRNQG